MKQMKALSLAGVITLAGLVAIGGLSACSRSDMNQRGQSGADGQNPGINQDFGKSYVRQVPESEVQRRETEMTSPEIRDKGPAVGSQTPNPDERDTDQQQQPMNNP